MQEGQRVYTEKSERVSGDLLSYFLAHNIISVLFFFVFTIAMGIYARQEDLYGFSWIQVIGYLISIEFWELTVFQIFPISIISSIIGRITAFYSIKGYYRYKDRKQRTRRTTKRWSELNRGINRMGLKFLITSLITSFIYSIGVITMLSYAIFDENTLLPLIVVYSVLKIGIHFLVRWLVGSKL